MENNINKSELVHISMINSGDAIIHNGELVTVSNNNIKRNFMSLTIFGDSYRLGYKLVERVYCNRN